MTGITIIPASLKRAMYLAGEPAPVVITRIFSSITKSTISSTKGDISIIFTPNVRSVNWRALSILSLITSFGACPEAIKPKPPALLTALAKFSSATHAIAP